MLVGFMCACGSYGGRCEDEYVGWLDYRVLSAYSSREQPTKPICTICMTSRWSKTCLCIFTSWRGRCRCLQAHVYKHILLYDLCKGVMHCLSVSTIWRPAVLVQLAASWLHHSAGVCSGQDLPVLTRSAGCWHCQPVTYFRPQWV